MGGLVGEMEGSAGDKGGRQGPQRGLWGQVESTGGLGERWDP